MLVTTENLVDIGPHGAEDRYLAPIALHRWESDGGARYLLHRQQLNLQDA
jgi:hypothetical protein